MKLGRVHGVRIMITVAEIRTVDTGYFVQRTARFRFSAIAIYEFITEKADYTGQKFRVVVEIEAKDDMK